MEELCDFSKQFVQLLLEAHPEWQEQLRVVKPDNKELGWLSIEIQSPAENGEWLLVSTEDDLITIGFADWHAHYDYWGNEELLQMFAGAIKMIDDLLAEKCVCVTYFRGEEICMASCEIAGIKPKSGLKTRIRSWLGNYDTEYQG